MMSYKMTAEQVVALGPCGHDGEDNGTNYTPERIQRLFAAAGLVEASAVDILRMGPELGISAQDLLWLVLHPEFIEPMMRAKFSLLCAEHVEAHSEAAQRANAVTRRFLDGAATLEELAAAQAAARCAVWAATGWSSAWDAALAAVWACWDARAVETAARATGRREVLPAEAEWQCKMLLSLLRGTSNDEQTL